MSNSNHASVVLAAASVPSKNVFVETCNGWTITVRRKGEPTQSYTAKKGETRVKTSLNLSYLRRECKAS